MQRVTDLLLLPLEHDEAAAPARDELFKHLGKVFGDLLERPLDRLVLARVEHVDQFEDRLLRLVELFLPRDELVSLLRERRVLLERLLVDVRKSLERFVDFAQLLEKL